ncbi:hypothetical protein JXC34_00170 [Candidatus Woesearchaeota archaeon]|nr:hypothetical protein [Candidatus Woesearchaeota archaeon]
MDEDTFVAQASILLDPFKPKGIFSKGKKSVERTAKSLYLNQVFPNDKAYCNQDLLRILSIFTQNYDKDTTIETVANAAYITYDSMSVSRIKDRPEDSLVTEVCWNGVEQMISKYIGLGMSDRDIGPYALGIVLTFSELYGSIPNSTIGGQPDFQYLSDLVDLMAQEARETDYPDRIAQAAIYAVQVIAEYGLGAEGFEGLFTSDKDIEVPEDFGLPYGVDRYNPLIREVIKTKLYLDEGVQ